MCRDATATDPNLLILLALCRSPWISARQIADTVRLPLNEIRLLCESLQASGFIQQVPQPLIYAPTDLGIAHLAKEWQTTPAAIYKLAGLSWVRFWQIRAMQPIVRDAGLFCSHLLRSQHAVGRDVVWEMCINRRYKGAELFLHARINILQGNHVQPFYLHLDNTSHPIWVWWRHLRYFETWAKQAMVGLLDASHQDQAKKFPPLLIVSPTRFRALSLAAMARTLAPSVTTIVTGDYATTLRQGPEAARWNIVLNGDRAGEPLRAVSCNPFLDGVSAVHKSRHIVKTVRTLAARITAKKRATTSSLAEPEKTFSFVPMPTHLSGIETFELASIQAHSVLAFLSHHSVCPASAMQQFLEMTESEVSSAVMSLQETSLIASDERRIFSGRTQIRRPLWSATESGVRLQYLSEGCCDVEQLTRRYLSGVQDHLRRSEHTRAVFDFFECLHVHATGWSRVTRPLNPPNGTDTNHYALEEFQDDVAARATFMVAGNHRRWQPDGYGVLRCGLVRKRFWLEIDGSSVGRAHNEPEVWEAKLGAMCDYAATGKWLLRHGAFPMLLIVTTDLRILNLIRDVLAQVVAARHLPMPQVFVASSAAIEARGPLAPIWKQAHKPGEDDFIHAFEPLIQPTFPATF